MKAIEFYKYIHENEIEIEYNWHYNHQNREYDVIFFPAIYDIKDLRKLLSANHYDDEGVPCRMRDGYFCFWASDILEYYGIELEEIFGENTLK